MSTTSQDKLEKDHETWSVEHGLWVKDIGRWQAEHEAVMTQLGRLQDQIIQHGNALRAHSYKIAKSEGTVMDHLQEETGSAADQSLAHERLAAEHARCREIHERIRTHHESVVGALKHLVDEIGKAL